MKKLMLTLCVACAAFLLFGCGAPAGNTVMNSANTTNTANSNANSKPAAAPTLAALKELETKAFEAWKNKDSKYFEGFLADNFIMAEGEHRLDKATTVKAMAENKCEVKSYSFADEKMQQVGADTAVVTMKVTADVTCEGQKMPSPVISSSVYSRSGDTWKGAFHSEVAIVDPKAPPPPPAKAADKKEAPKPPAANTAANANTAAPAKADDAATTALIAVEKRGWEAWKAKDAKTFEEVLAANFSFVDFMGNVTGSKADAIKMWTTDNNCEVKSVNVSDGHSYSIAKDASILLFKGSGEGTCNGMKVKPLWGMSVYVKEGEAWKLAYGFELPA